MSNVQQFILEASPAVKCLRQKRGAKVLVPKALSERRRFGKGIEWSLEACRYHRPVITFPERLEQEILGVLKGDSQALNKKNEQHGFTSVNRFVIDL